jgi:hypothetical protein
MARQYQLPESAAMPIPTLAGHYLARNGESRVVRAFLAADLHSGTKRLAKPTRLQSAYLARVSPTYVCWAEKRMDQRWEIERGLIPLVPTAPVHANGNGTMQPVMPDVGIDDAQLAHIANLVGADRMLAAAIAASH